MMFIALYLGMVNRKDQILRSVEARREADRERGSHTTDVLLWALAIIIIVGIAVIAALAGISLRLPRRRDPAYSLTRTRFPEPRDPRFRRR